MNGHQARPVLESTVARSAESTGIRPLLGPFHHPRLRWLGANELGRSVQRWRASWEGPLGFRRVVMVKCTVSGQPASEVVEGMVREAGAYARLDHPSLPRLLDFHEHEGHLVLITPCVVGTPLGEVTDWEQLTGARMPRAAAYHIGAQLFSALHQIHTARDPGSREFVPIVHQAVSPATITLTAAADVYLDDFGRSRTLASAHLTPSGLLGSHEGYLAPEQILGGRPSVRTDVYSACIVLRELLTGAQAFPRDDRDYLEWVDDVAQAVLVPTHRLVPDLEPEVRWLLEMGLRRDVEGRSLTASIAAQILGSMAAGGAHALAEHLARFRPPLISGAFLVAPSPSRARAARSGVRARPPALAAPALRPLPGAAALAAIPTTPPAARRPRTGRVVLATALALVLASAIVSFSVATRPRTQVLGAALPSPPSSPSPAPSVVAAPPTKAPPTEAPPTPPPRPPWTSALLGVAEATTLAEHLGLDPRSLERCFDPSTTPRSGAELRRRCADKPTLTVLRVEVPGVSPRTIGAFTCVPLTMYGGGWGRDPRAALFALDPVRVFAVRASGTAVDNRNGTFGPTFGAGHDLYVAPRLDAGMTGPRSYLTAADGAAFAGRFGPMRVLQLEVFTAPRCPK